MKLKFTKTFKFAHGGTQIECFNPGQIVENPSDRLYEIAIAEKAAIDPEIEEAVAAVEKPEKKPAKTKA